MPRIRNDFFVNKEVVISSERVKFDGDGVGTIESQELYDEVVKMPNFQPVDAPVAPPVEEEKPVEEKPDTKATTKATSKK